MAESKVEVTSDKVTTTVNPGGYTESTKVPVNVPADAPAVSFGAIARLVVLVLAIVNQGLVMAGYHPLPFTDEQVYDGFTFVATLASTILVWWKDNDFTKRARLRKAAGHAAVVQAEAESLKK